MEPRDLAHVVDTVLTQPWAVLPHTLTMVASILGRHLAGQHLSAADLQAAIGTPRKASPPRLGTIAVLPVAGVLMPRANMMHEASGLTSYDVLRSQLASAVDDPAVASIVLDVDSPGGNCAGLSEACKAILAARARKPIIAHANYTMASAAYALAASATEVVASPSASIGSIGVLSMHESLAKALDQHGIERTLIYAGKFKVSGNENEPLSPEARADIQARVDATYARMVTDIAHGRGLSVEKIRAGYGEGRVVDSDEALTLGMINRIESFDETLARLGARRDTPQEPQATGQDRAWALSMQSQLLQLGLP